MSNHIFVLDTNRKPLTPCKPGVARSLLKAGKASVFRRYPFTIILNKEVDANPEPLELKLDPGSKVTGIALKQGNHIIFAAELQHRGQQIKEALLSRRQLRRSRRNRKTRYRPARFLNRTRPEGWLAPSWQHRVDTLMTWVHRFRRLAPVGRITQELVRFDLQLMENPEISGVEYQQGELQGYEVREYLLFKWGRTCAYCGAQNVPLEVEQIQPRSKGGSDRVSNLTMACHSCNQAKGNGDIRDFLSGQPDVLSRLLRQAKSPLKDAAAVNSTRWALFKALKATGLPVTTGTGGQTKFNRLRLNLPKAHWLDAACVGPVESLEVLTSKPLLILAKGHGTRQMCGTNKYGFPNRHRSRRQIHKGFQTGDMVTALVTAGKKIGSYLGRVLCRASGSFDITTASVRVAGISHKYCQPIHSTDGYAYA
ncbi:MULTISPECIES: RNA-guided endonuclease IscB [unclassified Limnospira]|uniref:RNA-guided endonuclease IscB n=1 Tax=unclassified Limnospira TaxID=2642885 RepID=UPI0028E122C9|nr:MULTISPECIES: RNA-guided endonuclease IscB [unclassified Limnospira]MDT9191009.1 RNA-guided endonuclease IscB [Limnospira sp. PMC 894.15]MDT9201287.1 RNA-guided endonuclease IscB [Limnospira sp. PMC 1042.18]